MFLVMGIVSFLNVVLQWGSYNGTVGNIFTVEGSLSITILRMHLWPDYARHRWNSEHWGKTFHCLPKTVYIFHS